MLPFSLKVVWFVLSLTGLMSCWFVLMVFAKSVGSLWGPLLYCLGATVLQVVFCLGMIWRMDPYSMPRVFCIVQNVLLSFGSFFLTGVLAAFTMMTARTVFGAAHKNAIPNSTMSYHHVYLLPIVVFPVVASVAQIAVVMKLDAARPTDDMHCDATPMYVRFVGYAGVSVVVSIPCLVIAATTAWRLIQAHKISQRSQRQHSNGSNAISLRTQSHDLHHSSDYVEPLDYQMEVRSKGSPVSSLRQSNSTSRPPVKTPFTSDVLARKFHMPFGGRSQSASRFSFAEAKTDDLYDPESPTSSSFPTFAPPSDAPSLRSTRRWPESIDKDPEDLQGDELSDSDALSSVRWARDKDDMFMSMPTSLGTDERHLNPTTLEPNRHSRGAGTEPNSTTNMTSAIWRLVFFQMAFFIVESLAALSTLIDVFAHDSKPSPFGTQHIALVLAAWGPAFVFGHTPAIRRRLMFWR